MKRDSKETLDQSTDARSTDKQAIKAGRRIRLVHASLDDIMAAERKQSDWLISCLQDQMSADQITAALGVFQDGPPLRTSLVGSSRSVSDTFIECLLDKMSVQQIKEADAEFMRRTNATLDAGKLPSRHLSAAAGV
jgi:hypothetical protein